MQMLPAHGKLRGKNQLEMTTFLFLFSVSPGFCIFIHIWRKSVEKGTCLHYNFRFSQSNCPSKFPVPRVMLLRFPLPLHPITLFLLHFPFSISHPLSPGLVALFISLPAISLACHEQTARRPDRPGCPARPACPGACPPGCPGPACPGVFPMLKLYTYLQVMSSFGQSHRRSCSCGCSWHASLLFAV